MKRRTISLILGLALVSGIATQATAATYELDKPHSSIEFKIRHLAISKVSGKFNDFTVKFDFEPGQPESWRAEAHIEAASIDTENEDRDDHLRGTDFLDVEKFPALSFVSTNVQMNDENHGTLTGNLTLHGVTKPVTLDLEVHGVATFRGTTKAGFTATGSINRKDFGLTWSKALETGGLIVGNEVEIILEIEGNQVEEMAAG